MPRARAAWTVIALVMLALSLAGPLSGGVPTATKAARTACTWPLPRSCSAC